jgi:hypothetical protein
MLSTLDMRDLRPWQARVVPARAEPAFSNPSPHSLQAVCQSAHHMYPYSCPSCAPDQHVHVVNHRVFGLHMLACSSCHRHSCLALQDPFVPFSRFGWLPNTQLPVLRHQAASAQIFLVSLCLVGKTPCTIVHAVPLIQSHLFPYLSLPNLSLHSRLRKLGVLAKSLAVSYWLVSIPPCSHV